MKIALLTDGIYPDFVGGMQKHSLYLAKYFARNGVDVDLYLRECHAGEAGKLSPFTEEELSRIRLFSIPFSNGSYFPGHYLWQSFCYSSLIYEKLKENLQVDFIYAQGFTGWKLLNEKKRGALTPPIGVNFHGLEMFQKAPSLKGKLQQWMFRPFVRSILNKSDVVLSLGGKLDEIIEAAGVPVNRIFQSPNGVDSSWLVSTPKKPGDRRRFIFIGRYERRKGIEELSLVLKNFSEANEFDFDIVGPIPDYLRIKAPHIKYWGFVKDIESVREIMQRCDILVCPSHSEGMPTIVLEAMASGLAVIATAVGAVPTMVSEKNGWLIQPGDNMELEEAMKAAVTIPARELYEKQINSLLFAKDKFVWEKVIKCTLDKINDAIVRVGLF